jgi:hypothetical protein
VNLEPEFAYTVKHVVVLQMRGKLEQVVAAVVTLLAENDPPAAISRFPPENARSCRRINR